LFYYLSKIGGFFLAPSNALLVGVLLGLIATPMGWRRIGITLAALCLALLAACGLGPVGNWLILPLEERFPPVAADAPAPSGVIILGGGVDDRLAAGRGGLQLNEAGDRVLAIVELARRFPQATILVSGGTAAFFGSDHAPEAAQIARLAEGFGVDPSRILVEDRSRTTAENAAFSAEFLRERRAGRWWLVTSAFHMPRAIGAFREAGFDVVAFPVDYRTIGWRDAGRPFATVGEGLRRTDIAVREWIGLLAYYLTGRSSEILPSP